MLSVERPVRAWDLEEYDAETFADFWQTVNALPEGSVIATGFLDEGLVYFQRLRGTTWMVVQVDDPNVEDAMPVGTVETMESRVIDGRGHIDRAYVVREGKW